MFAKDFALRNKDKTSFNLLIEAGADVEKKDLYDRTLLDYVTASEEKFLGL